jgi:beta-lactamase superfamily II metal-dependent hydrolase
MFKHSVLILGLVVGAMLGSGVSYAASGNLEIYWSDAEGGASTLIVAPSGESLLMDTGSKGPDDRDPKRIFAAAQAAGLKKIDIVVITHFHGDHVGGLAALAKMIPIGMFMDHGETVEISRPNVNEAYNAYLALSAGKRRILHAGERIPLQGVDVDVIMAAGQSLAKARPGAGEFNPSCADFKERDPEVDPDNDQSVGIALKYGKFDFVDLGDLTVNYEQKMVCPTNFVGRVDLFQVSHHGLDRSNSPQLIWALQPTVAVMNNGPRKGGPPSVFATLRKSPGLQDIWQGHLALGTPVNVNTDEKMIANLDPSETCKGYMLKASVDAQGRFTVTNMRNGFSKTYESK